MQGLQRPAMDAAVVTYGRKANARKKNRPTRFTRQGV